MLKHVGFLTLKHRYILNITRTILRFLARQRTLFRNAYFNLLMHTAKCRSSFFLIGSTCFLFMDFTRAKHSLENARDGDGVLYFSGYLSFPVYRRLELVRLDRHTAYSLFSCAFFHPLLHSLSLLCK